MKNGQSSSTLERDYALDRDCKTLSHHGLEQLHSFSPDVQDLSTLMNRMVETFGF